MDTEVVPFGEILMWTLFWNAVIWIVYNVYWIILLLWIFWGTYSCSAWAGIGWITKVNKAFDDLSRTKECRSCSPPPFIRRDWGPNCQILHFFLSKLFRTYSAGECTMCFKCQTHIQLTAKILALQTRIKNIENFLPFYSNFFNFHWNDQKVFRI